ncbi:peptidoglycan editing factor PgeF [Vibrio sonorensis]|uniref:peptidoglycan editing factor PgeF n=1 Tax=Vibrio sonorensis TaxID=1004316 RepID=UPI0008D9B249|nr:peptidoglycan editing factor PgeF [Vibrio sonorensis]
MEVIVPNWPAPNRVKAFASTRVEGFSTGVYAGLNLGKHVGDDEQTVQQNREWLCQKSGMPSQPVWLNQTHSTHVASVRKSTALVLDADGAFTETQGVVCSAMTADCLPVLLCNTSGTQVAAVHAGWRGLADGILENAVNKFDGEVMAWLGPAITQKAFEVGQDVYDAFVTRQPEAKQAFVAGAQVDKFQADMFALATLRLNAAGVSKVYSSDLCTYNDEQRFYSYRRDGVTGRQATFIWIEDYAS